MPEYFCYYLIIRAFYFLFVFFFHTISIFFLGIEERRGTTKDIHGCHVFESMQ